MVTSSCYDADSQAVTDTPLPGACCTRFIETIVPDSSTQFRQLSPCFPFDMSAMREFHVWLGVRGKPPLIDGGLPLV